MDSLPTVLCAMQRLPDRLDEGAKFVSASDLAVLSLSYKVIVVTLQPLGDTESFRENIRRFGGVPDNISVINRAGFIVVDSGRVSKLFAFARSLFLSIPYVVSRHYSKDFLGEVLDLATRLKPNFVYVDGVSIGYLVPFLNKICPVLFRAHDVINETVHRMASEEARFLIKKFKIFEANRTEKFEYSVWGLSDCVIALSENNRAAICRVLPTSAVFKVSIHFPLVGAGDFKVRPGKNFLYFGNASYPPNMSGLKWFVSEVWRDFYQKFPSASLVLAGKGTEFFSGCPGVKVFGYVDNPDDVYEQAVACVVPLFSGSGIRLKIIDCIIQGVPVISTYVGAEGIGVENQEHLYLAESKSDWISVMEAVSTNGNERVEMASRAFEFVRSEYGFQRVVDSFQNACKTIEAPHG